MFGDKVVVITGATGGIGSKLASMLAKEEAKLVLIDLFLDKLKELSYNLGITTDNYLWLKQMFQKKKM